MQVVANNKILDEIEVDHHDSQNGRHLSKFLINREHLSRIFKVFWVRILNLQWVINYFSIG